VFIDATETNVTARTLHKDDEAQTAEKMISIISEYGSAYYVIELIIIITFFKPSVQYYYYYYWKVT